MRGVTGTRKAFRFFIASAGIVITSPSIQAQRKAAFSPGRNIEQAEKRKSRRIPSGAPTKAPHAVSSSRQCRAGMGVVFGGEKTRETSSSGLCFT